MESNFNGENSVYNREYNGLKSQAEAIIIVLEDQFGMGSREYAVQFCEVTDAGIDAVADLPWAITKL